MSSTLHRTLRATLTIVGCAVLSHFAPASSPEAPSEVPAPNRTSYVLFPQDRLEISIYGEPDLTEITRRIDGEGNISLPFIGSIKVAGLTVVDAEAGIRQAYIDREIFTRPNITLSIVEYGIREVSVIGEVVSPGIIRFPLEITHLDLVDAIGRAGGITTGGRQDIVRVTRRGPDGLTQSFTVDLKAIFSGRAGQESFQLLPGDVVFVPERIL